MINKTSKLAKPICIILELILVYSIVSNFISKNWNAAIFCIVTFICLMIPFLITRICNKNNISLPIYFETVFVIFLFLAQYVGEILRLYYDTWWYDLLIHAIFGVFAVLVILHILKWIFTRQLVISHKQYVLFTIVFAFCFSLATSALWEIFEFTGDYFFKMGMVKGGLEDTATDLIITVVTSVITCIKYYFHDKKDTSI